MQDSIFGDFLASSSVFDRSEQNHFYRIVFTEKFELELDTMNPILDETHYMTIDHFSKKFNENDLEVRKERLDEFIYESHKFFHDEKSIHIGLIELRITELVFWKIHSAFDLIKPEFFTVTEIAEMILSKIYSKIDPEYDLMRIMLFFILMNEDKSFIINLHHELSRLQFTQVSDRHETENPCRYSEENGAIKSSRLKSDNIHDVNDSLSQVTITSSISTRSFHPELTDFISIACNIFSFDILNASNVGICRVLFDLQAGKTISLYENAFVEIQYLFCSSILFIVPFLRDKSENNEVFSFMSKLRVEAIFFDLSYILMLQGAVMTFKFLRNINNIDALYNMCKENKNSHVILNDIQLHISNSNEIIMSESEHMYSKIHWNHDTLAHMIFQIFIEIQFSDADMNNLKLFSCFINQKLKELHPDFNLEQFEFIKLNDYPYFDFDDIVYLIPKKRPKKVCGLMFATDHILNMKKVENLEFYAKTIYIGGAFLKLIINTYISSYLIVDYYFVHCIMLQDNHPTIEIDRNRFIENYLYQCSCDILEFGLCFRCKTQHEQIIPYINVNNLFSVYALSYSCLVTYRKIDDLYILMLSDVLMIFYAKLPMNIPQIKIKCAKLENYSKCPTYDPQNASCNQMSLKIFDSEFINTPMIQGNYKFVTIRNCKKEFHLKCENPKQIEIYMHCGTVKFNDIIIFATQSIHSYFLFYKESSFKGYHYREFIFSSVVFKGTVIFDKKNLFLRIYNSKFEENAKLIIEEKISSILVSYVFFDSDNVCLSAFKTIEFREDYETKLLLSNLIRL